MTSARPVLPEHRLPGERGGFLRSLAEQRANLLITVRGLDDTLAGLLEEYAAAARTTEQVVAALPGLDRTVPLPKSPWGPAETVHWSARCILLHLIRETAQHAGHADIIREALDGASTTAQMAPPGTAA